MPRDRIDDETLSDPLKLLARYRELCEMAGALKVNGARVHREIQQDIKDVEAELQTRLWLATNGSKSEKRTEANEKRTANSEQEVARSEKREHSSLSTQDSSLHSPLFTLHTSSQSPVPSPQSSVNGVAEVYADGACSGNPGPGGYGAIVRVHGHAERELSGGKARTTNNEMELTGALEGLKTAIALGAREISVVSDSEYLVKGMSSWMRGWLRNGWKTRTGDPVKNRELWEKLHTASEGRKVSWNWVAGHAGHPENERCNTLAVSAAQKAASASRR